MIISKRAVSAVTTRPIFARTRFVHVERAAVEVVAIERTHRSFSLRVVVHRDEREATRFTGHTVRHQMDFVDRAVLFEQILKIVLGGLKREITYIQFHDVLNWKTTELQSRSRESGFKPPMSDAHLTIYRAVKLDSLNPIRSVASSEIATNANCAGGGLLLVSLLKLQWTKLVDKGSSSAPFLRGGDG